MSTSFIPVQDKGYLVAFAQLPDASSLDRTEDVIKKMSAIVLEHEGVVSAMAFSGISINGLSSASNAGIVFVGLEPFSERETPNLTASAIASSLNHQFGTIQDAFVAVFLPPPVMGLGTIGGFKLQIEDRSNLGYEALFKNTQRVLQKARVTPELNGVFSSFQIKVPQLTVNVDREKAMTHGVKLSDIFNTLQIYLGSLYINDFNLFGRTYQVNVQADKNFREDAEQIQRLKVRNKHGQMVPVGTFVTVTRTSGPDQVTHYNGYPAADISGSPGPGFSSVDAEKALSKILRDTLPNGMTYEWTDLAYQQVLAGDSAVFVFPLVVLLVFLLLAAQYESWSLPFVIILIVPMTLLSAISGVVLHGGDNNIFTQIGLIVLVGLAAKNAILIVEFARDKEAHGYSTYDAILSASQQRLRPILMTSIAFIMGVIPLILSSGPGSEMRQAIGIAVFWGMFGVTLFGLLFTPVFYYLIRKLKQKL